MYICILNTKIDKDKQYINNQTANYLIQTIPNHHQPTLLPVADTSVFPIPHIALITS